MNRIELFEALVKEFETEFIGHTVAIKCNDGSFSIHETDEFIAGESIMWTYEGKEEFPHSETLERTMTFETNEFDTVRTWEYLLEDSLEMIESGESAGILVEAQDILAWPDESEQEIMESGEYECIGWCLMSELIDPE